MREIFREELLDRADFSIYKLVMLVTKRALEIAEGAPKLIDVDLDAKPISIAMNEIAEGKVKYKKTKEKA
ncbi:MAG: DNA-directed RNA polymerase subunit omega [Omnitrophica WOR_2 bacterium RIFOXYA2_FULL_45_12]|nr:MAG: DNA-directed RNA polymerase subunit omega [Omnitrophica WOR_2 bacterium RIFOXYA2_FULL_45_12]OGX61288.1 MAG: DNA-directed RNA polymerase subunit omega [Omnitrophica WOR_2 bacterium RIFOXYC2_FULL_45_15]HBU08919.1 DNA-directed RNA polymerase subunit omega [Candidatus Omnitrophota bacterium]